jgi:hypothetical protein
MCAVEQRIQDLVQKAEGKRGHLGDQRVNGNMKLKNSVNKHDRGCGMDSSGSGQDLTASCYELWRFVKALSILPE